MNFFLNDHIAQVNSGIEHAEFKRLRLFHENNAQAKILTTKFTFRLKNNLKFENIPSINVINMFDFFAGNSNDSKKFTISDLNLPNDTHYSISDNDHGYRLVKDNKPVSSIHWWDSIDKQISDVWYYDNTYRLMQKDSYDMRGFLAISEIFNDKDNQLVKEEYFSDSGKKYLEVFFHQSTSQHKAVPTLYRLNNYKGKDFTFNTKPELISFFLDEINLEYGLNNTFISDRNNITNWAMTHMQTSAQKFEHIHNVHYIDDDDPNSTFISSGFSDKERLKQLTGIIAPSIRQTFDIQKRVEHETVVHRVPVGIIFPEQYNKPKVEFKNREKYKIVFVARLSVEKRLEQIINIVINIHQKLPQVTLDIYGYSNSSEEENKLKKIVKDNDADSYIKFKGYIHNINEVYDRAQIVGLTSKVEGLPLALIEATSHGVPTIAYDINYGPADIIDDGFNGALISDPSNQEEYEARLYDMLIDQDKLAKMSENAYKKAEDFYDTNVWKRWQEIIK